MGGYKEDLIEALRLRQRSQSILAGIPKDASYLDVLLTSLETPDLGELGLACHLHYLRSGFEGEVGDYISSLSEDKEDAEKRITFDRALRMTQSPAIDVKQSGFGLLNTLTDWFYFRNDFEKLELYRAAFTLGLDIEDPDILESSLSGVIQVLGWDVRQDEFNPDSYQRLVEIIVPVYKKYKATGDTSSMNEKEKAVHRILKKDVMLLVSYAAATVDKKGITRLNAMLRPDFLKQYDIFARLRHYR